MKVMETQTGHCEKHGAYEVVGYELAGTVFFNRKCSKCVDEAEAERARIAAEQAAREEVARWEQKLGHSCIPDRFRDRTLGSYVATTEGQKRALEFARAYADDFAEVAKSGRGALLIGKPGTGKTHLAVGIALQVMQDKTRKALFMTVMRAIRSIKDTWRKESEIGEAEAIDSLVKPDLLILDEVGIQFGSEAEKLLLFDVLNERYERRRPTLLLSNLSAPEVAAYLGERVMDRMREDGGQVVVFDWESHRGRK